MKKLIAIMSHEMTENQMKDANKTLGVADIIECDKEVKEIWGNINPKLGLDLSKLDLVINYIERNADNGDYILVQGEFGATFYIVDYCFKSGFIPVYATSVRRVIEEKDGDSILTKRIFKHEGFRKYIRYGK